MLDQVVAGEYALSPHTFNHQSVISAARGAPVAWIPVSPAMSVLSVGAITRDAPHPAAARLMADFYLSDEAQGIYANSGHGIVLRDLKTPVSEDARPFVEDGRLRAVSEGLLGYDCRFVRLHRNDPPPSRAARMLIELLDEAHG